MPSKNFFKGEILEKDSRLGEELREMIDDVKTLLADWAVPGKISETRKRAFFISLPLLIDTLGVSLAVEHLLPGLMTVITNPRNDPERAQIYVIQLFK